MTATLPVTLSRVLHHRRVTSETVLGPCAPTSCSASSSPSSTSRSHDLRDAPFFAQPGPHPQSEYLYFSFVALTTLGFGDLSPAVGLPQALTVLEALIGNVFLVTLVARLVTLWVRQDEFRHAGVELGEKARVAAGVEVADEVAEAVLELEAAPVRTRVVDDQDAEGVVESPLEDAASSVPRRASRRGARRAHRLRGRGDQVDPAQNLVQRIRRGSRR